MPKQKGIIYPTPETSENVRLLWEETAKTLKYWMLANDWMVYNSRISFGELVERMKRRDFLISYSFFENIRRKRLINIHLVHFVMVPFFWGYELTDFLKLGRKLQRQGWEFPRRPDGKINTQGNAGLCGKLAGQTREQVRKKVFKKRVEEARKIRHIATI